MTTFPPGAASAVPASLAEQLDWHWRTQLRPRLDGLTDDEYLWEPVPGCWNVRPAHEPRRADEWGTGPFTIDYSWPEPTPPPVTTIAWRMMHLVVGVLGIRVAAHFDGPPCGYADFGYAGHADRALAMLDEKYALWLEGIRGWSMEDLMVPVGGAEPAQWSHLPRLDLVLHISREMLHHGAELALLRDLYAHRS